MDRKKTIIAFLVFVICFSIMADVMVWGSLQKAQDDPTTIDEAIATAIANHNADSAGHLVSGGSLTNHKANDVIDHPVGSVLGDKKTMSELFFQTQFENSAIFGTHGSPTFAFPGFRMVLSATTFTNRKEVNFDGSSVGFVYSYATDFLFQFSFNVQDSRNATFVGQLGFTTGSSTENGVGLEVVAGVAKFFVAKENGSSKSYLSFPTYADDTPFVVRLQFVQSTGKIFVYVNGELLGTLTPSDLTESDPLYGDFYFYCSTNHSNEADVYDMTFAQSLV